ncbi:MAG: hypothetical protein HN576_07155 [Bacteriovoracaceae bacterium]|jgi:hypothetical protein|nr:hypothetical protein [Bacteriovoracaceae bacterium]
MENIKNKQFRKSKKIVVSLTSLIDLLFVMIFVSLIQQKTANLPPTSVKKPGKTTFTKTKQKVVFKPIVKKKVVQKVLKTYTVEAVFAFHATNTNKNIPTGNYKMKGSFDEKTRKLQLGGFSWINRPKNYDMVPLSGNIEKGDSLFIGRVEFPGCKMFTLKRSQKLNNSPISGTWEGIYDCSQGATGLTLTIQ